MSHPPTAAILQAMMEDLGLGRVEELPMEDRTDNRDMSRGGFRGGSHRGGFGGRGRGHDFGRVAAESVPAVGDHTVSAAASAWKSAIARNAFDDDDAAEVKGLDTLGGGNLHRMRNASEHGAPDIYQPRPRQEMAPSYVPPKRPDPTFRPSYSGHHDAPISLGPTRTFPPGYARTPTTGVVGGRPRVGNGAGDGNSHPQPRPQPPSTVATRVTPPSPVEAAQQQYVAAPGIIPSQIVVPLPVPAKTRLPVPDPSTVIIQDEVWVTVKNNKTFFQGRAYICNEPDPITASIVILVQNNAMEDQKYVLAQWDDYLHMEKCLIVCFEVSPGITTAHCLQFKTTPAMAKFAEIYKSLLEDRKKKSNQETLDELKKESPLLDVDKAVNRDPPQQKPSMDKSTRPNSITDSERKLPSLDSVKSATGDGTSQEITRSGQSTAQPVAPSPETLHVIKTQSSSQNPVNIETANIERTQGDSSDVGHFNQYELPTSPSGSYQDLAEDTPKEGSIGDFSPVKIDIASEDQTLQPTVHDQSDNDDHENTLREYLLRLLDSVKDLAKSKGLDSSADLDDIFRSVVKAFVAQTSAYYNELDEEGKKNVVQAYCDLAMKPRKIRRRSYSPEQLLDLRESAQAPSESDMRFIPPSPKSKSPSVTPVLLQSSLSGAATAFVPNIEATLKPSPEPSSLSEQIKKVAANAAWLQGSSDPVAARTPSKEKKIDDSVLPDKHTGLSGSRWASSTITSAANAGRFTGPLRGQDKTIFYPPVLPETIGADNSIQTRSLNASMDGTSDLPLPVIKDGTAEYAGAAKDLVGLEFSASPVGHAADLEGLSFEPTSTVGNRLESQNEKKNQSPKADLKIVPKSEQTIEPAIISPASVSSMGAIVSAFEQLNLTD